MCATIDPTFYRSAARSGGGSRRRSWPTSRRSILGRQPDAMAVVDVDPESGATARSSAGPSRNRRGTASLRLERVLQRAQARGPRHDGLERRYLLVPGIRSSRIYVLDTQPDPRSPVLVKTIDAAELSAKAGYSRPHTLHCGPDGVFLTCLGGPEGDPTARAESPCSITRPSRSSGRWETDHGPQQFSYDAWWHLNRNVLISSEWGTPSMIEDGVVPGTAARPEVRPRGAFLGSGRGQAPAARRSRRRAPDGARAPAVARSGRRLGLHRRRRQHRGSVGLGLALVSTTTASGRSRR